MHRLWRFCMMHTFRAVREEADGGACIRAISERDDEGVLVAPSSSSFVRAPSAEIYLNGPDTMGRPRTIPSPSPPSILPTGRCNGHRYVGMRRRNRATRLRGRTAAPRQGSCSCGSRRATLLSRVLSVIQNAGNADRRTSERASERTRRL